MALYDGVPTESDDEVYDKETVMGKRSYRIEKDL